MSRRYYYLNDPAFTEYVFHCMMSCSQDKKNELSTQELKHFKDSVSIRRFAENETLDKRVAMLTRIGAQFTMLMSFENPRQVLEGLRAQYDSENVAEKRSELIKMMNEKKMFVFGSRELTNIVNYAAQNSHSQVYILNYEFVRHYEFLKTLKKESYVQDTKTAAKMFDAASSLFLNAIISTEVLESIAGVNEYEMKILLALYPHRNTYVTRDTLAGYIGETKRMKGVAKVTDKIIQRGYVLKMVGSGEGVKPLQYTISEEGINSVCKYVKYVFAQLNKF